MASRKGIKAKMLKWMGKEAHAWINDMLNDASQHGMPFDWSTNWTKPLHKVLSWSIHTKVERFTYRVVQSMGLWLEIRVDQIYSMIT